MSVWSPRLVEPAELAQAASRLLEGPFVQEYGAAPWLAISLPPGEEGLAAALRAAHQPGQAAPSAPQQIEFHTQMATAASLRSKSERKTSPGRRAVEDLPPVLGDRCFFSAVRKRVDGGGALGERVSVGRAMNKDIVLRHASISKFHAYLERHEGVWAVTDAGSKNGTSVEGVRLGVKESRGLASGERVTFGSIQTVFLDTQTVWRLLHAR